MVQHWEVTEVEIDGRTFWVRPVGSGVLESGNVVAEALALSLDKTLEWAIGFFFGNVELSLKLWNIISGISGFDNLGNSSNSPECGTNLFERTERNAKGTVKKTFHCYNCGSIWRPDSEDDVPECRVGKPTVPKVKVELALRRYCARTIFSKRPSP